jgi:uncharacterized protein YcbK (DUF882 family)
MITKNFSKSEIACPCCGNTDIDPAIVEIAQMIRDELGVPLYVPEGGGKRCDRYHNAIGKYYSAHQTGQAIDLYMKPFKLSNMLKIAHLGKELGATRIGLYPDYTVKSVHLDLWKPSPSESWVRVGRGYIYFKHFKSAVKFVKENYL